MGLTAFDEMDVWRENFLRKVVRAKKIEGCKMTLFEVGEGRYNFGRRDSGSAGLCRTTTSSSALQSVLTLQDIISRVMS